MNIVDLINWTPSPEQTHTIISALIQKDATLWAAGIQALGTVIAGALAFGGGGFVLKSAKLAYQASMEPLRLANEKERLERFAYIQHMLTELSNLQISLMTLSSSASRVSNILPSEVMLFKIPEVFASANWRDHALLPHPILSKLHLIFLMIDDLNKYVELIKAKIPHLNDRPSYNDFEVNSKEYKTVSQQLRDYCDILEKEVDVLLRELPAHAI